jgi:adenylate cyclase class IV
MREIELKAVIDDVDALRARLVAADAVPAFSGTLIDRRYDTADGALVAADHVLRLRTYRRSHSADRSVLDWKGATEYVNGYKVREESTTDVGNAAVLDGILSALGFGVIRTIERDIEMFELEGAILRIEHYPRMDTLLEVEGTPESIERAILSTGIARDAFTAERLTVFVARFEARSGTRAALSHRELAVETLQESIL